MMIGQSNQSFGWSSEEEQAIRSFSSTNQTESSLQEIGIGSFFEHSNPKVTNLRRNHYVSGHLHLSILIYRSIMCLSFCFTHSLAHSLMNELNWTELNLTILSLPTTTTPTDCVGIHCFWKNWYNTLPPLSCSMRYYWMPNSAYRKSYPLSMNARELLRIKPSW